MHFWHNFCNFAVEMIKIGKILTKTKAIIGLICVLGMFGSVELGAQNSASSPYSLYGHGELNDNTPGAYRAMGGVGIGMRNSKVINSMQPASYTAGDSLTFMFDVAATVSWSRYQDASGMRNKGNGNLEYITLQFPLYRRWIALSLGALPYSASGYSFSVSDSLGTDGSNYAHTKTYMGSGSVSQVYGGLSFNICNWVAVGANLYYLFGTSSKNSTLVFTQPGMTSTIVGEYFDARTLRYKVGMQVFHDFQNCSFTLGGTFESKLPMNADYYLYESSTTDSIVYADGLFEMPLSFGVGASFSWNNRLTVAADYSCQRWSEVLYRGETNQLKDRHHVALGVEYRNNPFSRHYADQMLWRMGVNYGTSYVKNVTGPEFMVTAGMGFPLKTIGTQINVTLEYAHRGPRSAQSAYLCDFRKSAGMQDNTIRLVVNASVCENWFFKRKI